MNDLSKIEVCARAAHEVNRVYCVAIGQTDQVPWNEAPGWQKSSCINGVLGVLAGDGPGDSHARWLEEKRAGGWKHGPAKDEAKKEHPCFVPYADLSPEDKAKDDLFISTVRAMAAALGLEVKIAPRMFAVGDVVRHKKTGMVGKVDDVIGMVGKVEIVTAIMVDGTGPYPAEDFERLEVSR